MRIGALDVYKFFFAWVICFYHFGDVVSPSEWFPMGNVVVELFTLISGVFFFRSWEREKTICLCEKDKCFSEGGGVYAFLKKRFLRFFPYTTVAFLFAAFVRAYPYIMKGTLLKDHRILEWFSQDIWEILLIKMNGMNGDSGLLNVPAWTVSAMFIVEFIAFSVLTNWEKVFKTFICPCTIIIGFGVWRQLESTSYRAWLGFTTFGVLRIFIITCLSFYCFKLIDRIKNTKFTTTGKFFLSAAEWSLYGVAIYLIMNFDNRPFRWLTILIFFFAVAITASGNCFSSKLFAHSWVTDYLGELSLGIYLIHYPIYRIFKSVWTEPYEMFQHKLLFALVVLIAANIFLLSVKYTYKMFQLLGRWVKTRFIQIA